MSNIYRYERKFILPKNYSIDSVESVLIRSRFIFSKQHEDRFVNSIYFDSKNLNSVKENLDGVLSKKKIRLRWYGSYNFIQNPRLELKFKKGYLNTKKIFQLKNFKIKFFEKNLNAIYTVLLKKYNFLKNYKIVTSTHYRRKYFISKINNIRATIDTDIFYKKLRLLDNFDLNNNDSRPILELKYKIADDNYVRANLQNLTLRFSKNSKYINSLSLQ
tara:strand:- start:10761 stop:11411 length:651 start_codon:yes stop_codon:yes gene_type:complete